MLRDPEKDSDESLAYQFEYLAASETELARYEADFAPALKKDHSDRFAGKVVAWREKLQVVELP